jgi:DNA-directed RNA polymerase II subunit RPB2
MSNQSFDSRYYAESLLKKYFKTFSYPFTHHQINSFDQFVSNDIPAIIKAANPILLLEEKIGNTDEYAYKVEIFIGGLNGDQFFIGTPTLSLKNNEEIRILYPNEARLRNLTYASTVEAAIIIRVTFVRPNEYGKLEKHEVLLDSSTLKEYDYLARIPLFQLPIMLHSRYCLLHDKPNVFLKDVGECTYDYGGYFIVDGAEKVLITRQEQAFNTLYITKQEKNPKSEIFASIQCLNPKTRLVKRVAFNLVKNKNTIEITIPFVRKAVPLFVLFRAFGVQTDEDILRCIFPNENDTEAKILAPLLHESLLDAHPLLDTYSAIQYMKVLTKGFSEAHIYDILYNQTFIHVDNAPMNKALYLADCVRKILRVKANYDTSTDKDDIRNQRCLTSGFLVRMLFQNAYNTWTKQVARTIDKEYKYNTTIYSGQNFLNIFLPGNINTLFNVGFITEGINRGFKGKWSSGVGEEKSGVLQPLSRLSYLDFLSHCRRVVLDFDTSMGLQGPRRLHTTQFGYFCTSETPGGSSIGITKNLSILTAVSISMEPQIFTQWLYNKMEILEANNLTPLMMKVAVPVYVNSGIIGFCLKPQKLVEICKLMKYTGCLPAYSSITFNIRERRVSFYFDEGRPMRPVIFIKNGKYPYEKIKAADTWRELVMGSLELTKKYDIPSITFTDPLVNVETPSYEDYIEKLAPHIGCIEYIDPYESNEAYIAMYPELITKESTHVELHPSTMVGLLTSMIPFPNHNQSPRNQLSCSQSKQGISIYSTNYMNRYDNQTHLLCYGEAPLVRTLYYDYVADGQIGYGHNLVLAMGCFSGYNQEDGIVFNADSIQRGLFRNMTFRSYEAFEEDDDKAHTKTRIANPLNIPGWTSLKSGVDYRKLDERGIIKKGEYVDENTVIVGRYIQAQGSDMKDASVTAQVWTTGTVQDVVVTVNNKGLALVKIRVLQDRIPELGDKFCLTEDHDVLTEARGWVSIKDVTIDDKVAQLNKENNTMEYVNPKEKFVFDCNEELYEVESQGVSLKTTMNHRMWVKEDKEYQLTFAKDIIHKNVWYQGINEEYYVEKSCGKLESYQGKVYCISVPSEVFLVRRNGRIVFTGNSNRHGQKGTIGMLVRAVDMPRSINGIVPDMIMNPHAIPSRMTIAQLLESILGKSACLAGFIGDATAFMNEGGIEENIGNVLTNQFGLQKHGEEILYDGTTGIMIPSTIFMGNVYTMRLKHMVEDKWNARGEGRREQRTHQPTGGRGNQGGLRIGEMETWALEGHGIASFFRETLMKRSDGTEMIICNGCGTVPIYNVKNNFYLCSLCDGPVQFVGDNLNNFELLPTLKRSTSTFSKIEIPYSSEVLNKELNTYMNIGLRYLTTKDVSHLRRTPLRGLNEKEVQELLNAELQPRVYKNLNQPEFREGEEEEKEIAPTDEQLEQLGVTEEAAVEEDVEPEEMPKLSIQSAKESVDLLLNEDDVDDITVSESVVQSQPTIQMQTMQMQPIQTMMQPVMMMMPVQSQVPNAPATLVVDTSQQAMQAQGIPTLKEDLRPRSILKRPNSPSRFRSASNSPTNNGAKPTFSINKLDSSENGSGNADSSSSSSSNMKINIVKEE